jgi:murein DD-endopeptidase MepM/ murein hydrolase activator NlpD
MDVPTSVTPFDLHRTFTLDAAGKEQPLDREKLATMAREFESMLLLQMIRQMRQSMVTDEEEEDTGFGNATMTDTFDVEFANYLAKTGGLGLNKAITAQFERQEAAKAAAAAEALKSEPTLKPLDAPVKSVDLHQHQSYAITPNAASGAAAAAHAPNAARGEAAAAAAADGRVQGHASALHSEIPPFSGEGGQGGQGETLLTLPLDSDSSSAYGWRSDPFKRSSSSRKFHSGVDFRAAYGTDVPTAAPGKVTFAGERGSYGLLVVVEHPNGLETRYAHLSSTAVQPGDSVAAGQTIGRVGSSGRSTGPHLHFEVLLDGKRVNPEQIASARSTAPTLASAASTLAQ